MSKNSKNSATATPADVLAALTPEQAGILDATADAIAAAESTEAAHGASLWSVAIRRIREATAVGLKRMHIATRMGRSTGSLSRHMVLAAHDGPVMLPDGREYPGVVEALDAGVVSAHRLYDLTRPVNPTRGRKSLTLQGAFKKLFSQHVQYQTGKKRSVLAVLESRADWRAAVAALLSFGKVSADDIESILTMIPVEAPAKPEKLLPAPIEAPRTRTKVA